MIAVCEDLGACGAMLNQTTLLNSVFAFSGGTKDSVVFSNHVEWDYANMVF